MSHGTCGYICVYTTAVAISVALELYLLHDFYNVTFTIKHKLYIASRTGPRPVKNSGSAPGTYVYSAVQTSQGIYFFLIEETRGRHIPFFF